MSMALAGGLTLGRMMVVSSSLKSRRVTSLTSDSDALFVLTPMMSSMDVVKQKKSLQLQFPRMRTSPYTSHHRLQCLQTFEDGEDGGQFLESEDPTVPYRGVPRFPLRIEYPLTPDYVLHVRAEIDILVHKLTYGTLEEQRSAVVDLLPLAGFHSDNRKYIGEAGAVPPLIGLVSSSTSDPSTRDHAIAVLRYLTAYYSDEYDRVDSAISREDLPAAVSAVVRVIREEGEGGNMGARENAAAMLCNLSVNRENIVIIGETEGAIPALVSMLTDSFGHTGMASAWALFELFSSPTQAKLGRAKLAEVVPSLKRLATEPNKSGMAGSAKVCLHRLSQHLEGKAALDAAGVMPYMYW